MRRILFWVLIALLALPSGSLAAEFLRFVHSDEARRLVRASGYIPLPEDQ